MNHNDRFYSILKTRVESDANRINALFKPRPISCDYQQRTSAIAYPVQPWQRNPYGEAHGGVIATMFDTAMGVTAHWFADGHRATTVDLAINYIAPLPCGEEMIVYSRVQKAGRTLIRLTAEGKSAGDGKLIATASANFMILR